MDLRSRIMAVALLIALGGCLFAAALLGADAATAAAPRELPAGILIADDRGIAAGKDGAFFLDAQHLRPGEVVTKKLTIKNDNRDTPFRLGLSVQPGEATGPSNLLDKVRMELVMDGKTLYEGRVRGTDGVDLTKHELPLGSWKYGDARDLTVRLTVDKDIRIGYQKSEATVGWTFKAVRDTQAAAAGPKTGDGFLPWVWAFGALFSLMGLALAAARLWAGRRGAEGRR